MATGVIQYLAIVLTVIAFVGVLALGQKIEFKGGTEGKPTAHPR